MSEERNEQSLNPKEIHIETEVPDNKSKLEILSDEYSRYLNFKDLQEHEMCEVMESLSLLVGRTDELGTHIDGIQANTVNQINEIAPELNEKAIHLKTLFKTVDHLRTLFDKIKQNIDALEAQVVAADRANSSISVKKIFNIFSRKKYTDEETYHYNPVDIVNTNTFFEEQRKELSSENV